MKTISKNDKSSIISLAVKVGMSDRSHGTTNHNVRITRAPRMIKGLGIPVTEYTLTLFTNAYREGMLPR